MRSTAAAAVALLLAVACSDRAPPEAGDDSSPAAASPEPAEAPAAGAPGWNLQSSGGGVALALLGGSGEALVRLFCPAGRQVLLVNVPEFKPVGSEERMSLGSGGQVVVLVADSSGDPQRGGVSAAGPTPDNLAALIGGPVAVNYGAQDSGPHPAPPAQAARAFAAACGKAPPAGPPSQSPDGTPAPAAGACRMQDGKAIAPNLLRAVGTEPFWGARIEGRCVTYSHPEDQSGTRIWTRFTGSRERGAWTGFYAGQRFVFRTRPQAGCSDGMSDRRYPLAVSLTVAGEQRSGCAE